MLKKRIGKQHNEIANLILAVITPHKTRPPFLSEIPNPGLETEAKHRIPKNLFGTLLVGFLVGSRKIV